MLTRGTALRWTGAACASALTASVVLGASQFSVRVLDSNDGTLIGSAADSSPVALSTEHDDGALSIEGSAGRGLLGMRASYVAAHGPGAFVDLEAIFVADDLMITGPDTIADASFVIEVVGWSTRPVVSEVVELQLSVDAVDLPVQVVELAGFSASSPASAALTFGPVSVPVGVVQSLAVRGTTFGYGADGPAFHGLQWNVSFATDAVVLPAGHSADAPSIGIAANVWTPPCPPDIDGGPGVDIFDLLTYLDLWFAGDPAAEWTGDDPASIDIFDLLAYLDGWFEGC